MTVENFLQTLIETAFAGFSVYTGNGTDFATFLDEQSTTKPSAFISYEGFNDDDTYVNGDPTEVENYKLYLRTDDSVKPYVKQLKTVLKEQYEHTFTDEDGNERYVKIPSGTAYRDNGSDAFELSITIL